MAVDFARFPARIVASDGSIYDPAAILVSDKVARVARRLPNQQADELPDFGVVTSWEKLPNRDTIVRFVDGSTLTVGRGAGCSCSSPLKTWYAGVVHEAQ